jgi:hypothetical protein
MGLTTVVLLLALWVGVVLADDSRYVFANQTVTDERTKLIWTRDANLGQCSWEGSFGKIKELNETQYAGYKDWRLPNKNELMTLATYALTLGYNGNQGEHTPAELLNQIGFYNVMGGCYWSSNNDIFEIKYAWCIYMGDGSLNNPEKYTLSYIWPVRGGQ